MDPDRGFPLFLCATVVLLIGAIVTGLRAKRSMAPHLSFVAGAVVSLWLAIYFAVLLGDFYDLEPAEPITSIHMLIAKIATLSFIGPLVTGALTLRKRTPRRKRAHLVCALIAVVLTVAATVTGAWMLYLAERLA